MRHAKILVAIAIVTAEVASVGVTAMSASAQESTSQVRRQQRLILQQQRQIEQNQRRLDAQQQQLARAPAYGAPAPRNLDRGIFGNIGNCPVGWTYSLFSGCLPAVVVIH